MTESKSLITNVPTSMFALEGNVVDLEPGIVWNGFREIYVKYIEENGAAFLCLYQDKSASKVLEKLSAANVTLIHNSKANELVFKVHVNPQPPSKKKTYFFKVMSKDERDKWIMALLAKMPHATAPIIPPKVVDVSSFQYKGNLTQLYPGYVVNSFRPVFCKFAEGEKAIVLYETDKETKVLEKYTLDSIDSVTESKKNELIFVILLKGDPLTKKAPQKIYLKSSTTTLERDQWAFGLNAKLK